MKHQESGSKCFNIDRVQSDIELENRYQSELRAAAYVILLLTWNQNKTHISMFMDCKLANRKYR